MEICVNTSLRSCASARMQSRMKSRLKSRLMNRPSAYSLAGQGRCGEDQSSSVPTTERISGDCIATVTAIQGRPLASDR